MARAKQPVSINGIEFDALIDESRTLEATVPEYSVESGFSVSDAIILSPEKLDMTLFVTNTPGHLVQPPRREPEPGGQCGKAA